MQHLRACTGAHNPVLSQNYQGLPALTGHRPLKPGFTALVGMLLHKEKGQLIAGQLIKRTLLNSV